MQGEVDSGSCCGFMGDSVIRIILSAHPNPLKPSLPLHQSNGLAPSPTNTSPPTASQKDPLSAGGQVSGLNSLLAQCQRL
uniref:Proline-rich transmembrane protein 2 n=2 Tax=Nothobranchius kadleci TaxID=1051664 RepID=A0A1A8E0G8_NOTKA